MEYICMGYEEVVVSWVTINTHTQSPSYSFRASLCVWAAELVRVWLWLS